MEPKILVDSIAELIFSKKGYDVKILDLKTLTPIADYFVICSADSDTQVKAIADEIDKKLRDEGVKSWHVEGYKSLNWVLLDYVDVVVHIFKKETREFYNIEKLWGDAPILEVADPLINAVQKKGRKTKSSAVKTSAKSSETTEKKKVSKSTAVKKTTLKKEPAVKKTALKKTTAKKTTTKSSAKTSKAKPKE